MGLLCPPISFTMEAIGDALQMTIVVDGKTVADSVPTAASQRPVAFAGKSPYAQKLERFRKVRIGESQRPDATRRSTAADLVTDPSGAAGAVSFGEKSGRSSGDLRVLQFSELLRFRSEDR